MILFYIMLVLLVIFFALLIISGLSFYWKEESFSLYWSTFYLSKFIEYRLRNERIQFLSSVGIKGKVLDFGSGDGVNLHYFLPYRRDIESITIVEPNKSFYKSICNYAKVLEPVTIRIYQSTLEQYIHDYPDEKFDVITGLFVLCSVDDPTQVVEVLYNSLKTKGKLALLEHIKVEGNVLLILLQYIMSPIHYSLGGRCSLRREHSKTLHGHAWSDFNEKYFTSYKLFMPWMPRYYTWISTK